MIRTIFGKKEVNRLCVLGFESFAFLIQIRFLLVTGSSNYYASFDVFIFILHDSTNYMKYISIHTYIHIYIYQYLYFFMVLNARIHASISLTWINLFFNPKLFFFKKKICNVDIHLTESWNDDSSKYTDTLALQHRKLIY